MREQKNPGPFLKGGEFYSPVTCRLRTEKAVLSELRQPVSRAVPRHEHELAYVTMIINGDYREGDHGKLADLPPFTAVFNPAGVQHTTLIGPKGAWFFTVELPDSHLRRLDLRLPGRTEFDRGAGPMLWPMMRLYKDFKAQTADALVLESHVLELLGEVAGFESGEKISPQWLRRAEEHLREEFCEKISMRDLARDADVHPVHLARAFRAYLGLTPGDYLQRVRVRAACGSLLDPAVPLAAIALQCGFADQSHFTRVFRKFTGNSPAQFRRTMASLSS